jgi:hypothetical protein
MYRAERRRRGLQVRLEISPEDAASFPEDESAWTAEDHERFKRFVRVRAADSLDGRWLPLPATCAES